MRQSTRTLTLAAAGTALLALTGCAASAPAPESTTEWTIPISSSEGGCSGSVAVTGSADWALVEGRLGRTGAEITASCDSSDRYADYVTAWDLPSVLASVYPDGNCDDAPEADLSGQPGIRCEYDYDGTHWMYSIALIGDKYVQIGGGVQGAESVRAEVTKLLDSIVLTID